MPLADPPYIGRFAPSPTGPLHAGSLVAALASRLDALAHHGRWLIRIEDLDPPREVPGATEHILHTLAAYGFVSDGQIIHQSRRHDAYQQAFEQLQARGGVYPCGCTRKEIADSLRHRGIERERFRELIYPGTCREGLPPGRSVRAWRLRVGEARVCWQDRAPPLAASQPKRVAAKERSAPEAPATCTELLADTVGDFVLKRADGLWAYQLAVVIDDAWQGVNNIVRGDDLRESTARQIHLQERLGLPRPRYLHLPVVVDARGEKLSKQTGAQALDPAAPLPALEAAMRHLGLKETGADSLPAFWAAAVARWRGSDWMRDIAPEARDATP